MKTEFLTPILLLVFNRPDKTKLVFDQIKKIKPKFLYIGADGPRKNKETDIQKCNEVRNIVREIDWECEIRTLFRNENLGCSKAITTAIDWFFQNEDYGIILEDDCFPDLSFFPYCDELLRKYKDNSRIMLISGSNLGINSGIESYYFSRYGQIWGWATWKRAWGKYEKTVNFEDIKDKFVEKREEWFWKRNFKKIIWDVQWAVYSVWKNDGIAILPNTNLVSNIGFGLDATNYKDENNVKANIKTDAISLPLWHPDNITIQTNVDMRIFHKNYYVPLHKRIIKKLKERTLSRLKTNP